MVSHWHQHEDVERIIKTRISRQKQIKIADGSGSDNNGGKLYCGYVDAYIVVYEDNEWKQKKNKEDTKCRKSNRMRKVRGRDKDRPRKTSKGMTPTKVLYDSYYLQNKKRPNKEKTSQHNQASIPDAETKHNQRGATQLTRGSNRTQPRQLENQTQRGRHNAANTERTPNTAYAA